VIFQGVTPETSVKFGKPAWPWPFSQSCSLGKSHGIRWIPMDPGTPAVFHIPPAASFEFDVHVEKAPPKKKLYLISSYIILYLIYILYIYIIYIYHIYISYISYIPLFFGLDSTKFDLSGGGNFDVQLSIHLAVRDHALIEKLLPNRTGCFSWLNKMGIQMGFIMVEAHD
jgi:hypothetical protein